MEQKDERRLCMYALATTERHMQIVAAEIANSLCPRETAELSERLNTIDNGRIVLKQMVDQHGSEGAI